MKIRTMPKPFKQLEARAAGEEIARDPHHDPRPGDILRAYGEYARLVVKCTARSVFYEAGHMHTQTDLGTWQKWCAEKNPSAWELSRGGFAASAMPTEVKPKAAAKAYELSSKASPESLSRRVSR